MASYTSPTTNRPPEFTPAAGYGQVPQSPVRGNQGMSEGPTNAGVPVGMPPPQHMHHMHHHHPQGYGYQPARHQMPPPPPYGTDPPYGVPGAAPDGGMPAPPPPPPSYEEHLARERGIGERHGSPHPHMRVGDSQQPSAAPPTPPLHGPGSAGPALLTTDNNSGAFMPNDRTPQSPSSAAPPPYNARFRHDPYSHEGSRVVSPNRANVSSPIRQAASPNRRDAA